MQETNYCAHAIDGLKKVSKHDIHPQMREVIRGVIPKLRNAAHFRLPEDGKVFKLKSDDTILGVLRNYCPQIRLPYPVITMEYAGSDSSGLHVPKGFARGGGSVLLAHEQEVNGKKRIIFSPIIQVIFPDGSKEWFPSALGAWICTEDVTWGTFPQQDSLAAETTAELEMIVNEVTGHLTVLVQFLAALACSNTATRDAAPPNAALNAKRINSGKTPFFTYKELTITGQDSNGAATGGTHGSPRVHLRRGHIRRLPEKTVWVNACVVGDKSKGLVHKDYKLAKLGED